ncbi:hypothetical protein AB6A40_010531 [Gnathostoma spinigerum]|uniref:Uncharacterized protein n=1 Tax=Gnathostoma spinigerum TaxID=75299 RepID=A0ABD6F2M0_9BILA
MSVHLSSPRTPRSEHHIQTKIGAMNSNFSFATAESDSLSEHSEEYKSLANKVLSGTDASLPLVTGVPATSTIHSSTTSGLSFSWINEVSLSDNGISGENAKFRSSYWFVYL